MLAVAILATGCVDADGPGECTDPELVGALEFGTLDDTGNFVPITDGDPVAILINQAAPGILPSLRARELDPIAPEPSVTVWVDGVFVGADLKGGAADMVPDGDAHVLGDLRVLFDVDPCCVNCLEAVVEGTLVDRQCRACTGRVTVILQASGSCPPPTSFCGCDESSCPAPLTPQPCAD